MSPNDYSLTHWQAAGVGLLVTNPEGKTLVTALNPYYISSMHEMNCQS